MSEHFQPIADKRALKARATDRGVTAQGAKAQRVPAQGVKAKRVKVQGVAAQHVPAQGTKARGVKTQGVKAQGVKAVDCVQGMKSLPNDSISCILTDPPYFMDGMDDRWDHRHLRRRCKGTGTVGGLPVGMKFDPRQGRRLQAFLTPIARQWLRIIKPGGFALCFSQGRLVHRAAVAIEDAGFEIRDLLAWKYEGQAKAFTQEHFVRRKNLPKAQQQRIIKALGGRKTPQLKPQMEAIVLAQAPREGTFVDNWLKYQTGLIDTATPLIDPERFPGTIIPVPKPRERHGHMTAKPVSLLRHLIRIFCVDDPEAVVFDPFAGSGSTGEAAILEGRDFLGFELDPDMARTAQRRLAAVAPLSQ